MRTIDEAIVDLRGWIYLHSSKDIPFEEIEPVLLKDIAAGAAIPDETTCKQLVFAETTKMAERYPNLDEFLDEYLDD